jgi:cell division septum initiation protein DivIVA
MDIQHLVDRLEDLIDEGRHMPFSKFTMIDEERALELIDQMRISIPEEIEKSSRILSTRDRILAQANEEGARVVQIARKKGEEMLDQEVSVQAAHNRAANIIEQARLEAENIIADADKYVLDELSRLEQHLIKTLTVVRNGMVELSNNRAAAQAARSEAAQQMPMPPQMPVQQPVQMPRPEMQFAPREQVEINSDNS